MAEQHQNQDEAPPTLDEAARKELGSLYEKRQKQTEELLGNIKARLSELTSLLEEVNSHWHGEDRFYRFYHQSFKVYSLQEDTVQIVDALRSLRPEQLLNPWFEQIIQEGTGKEFRSEHNQRWLQETRPILEAFFHARTMLELAVRYGKELKQGPQVLPSGWAAVLYLYNLR